LVENSRFVPKVQESTKPVFFEISYKNRAFPLFSSLIPKYIEIKCIEKVERRKREKEKRRKREK